MAPMSPQTVGACTASKTCNRKTQKKSCKKQRAKRAGQHTRRGGRLTCTGRNATPSTASSRRTRLTSRSSCVTVSGGGRTAPRLRLTSAPGLAIRADWSRSAVSGIEGGGGQVSGGSCDGPRDVERLAQLSLVACPARMYVQATGGSKGGGRCGGRTRQAVRPSSHAQVVGSTLLGRMPAATSGNVSEEVALFVSESRLRLYLPKVSMHWRYCWLRAVQKRTEAPTRGPRHHGWLPCRAGLPPPERQTTETCGATPAHTCMPPAFRCQVLPNA